MAYETPEVIISCAANPVESAASSRMPVIISEPTRCTTRTATCLILTMIWAVWVQLHAAEDTYGQVEWSDAISEI
jgi:hypothetical protein